MGDITYLYYIKKKIEQMSFIYIGKYPSFLSVNLYKGNTFRFLVFART